MVKKNKKKISKKSVFSIDKRRTKDLVQHTTPITRTVLFPALARITIHQNFKKIYIKIRLIKQEFRIERVDKIIKHNRKQEKGRKFWIILTLTQGAKICNPLVYRYQAFIVNLL